MQYDIQNCNVFMTLERDIYIYITTGTPFYEGRHIVSPCFYRRWQRTILIVSEYYLKCHTKLLCHSTG